MLCKQDSTEMVPEYNFGKSVPGTTSGTMQYLAFCREKSLSELMKSMKYALMLNRGTPTLFSCLSKDTLQQLPVFTVGNSCIVL